MNGMSEIISRDSNVILPTYRVNWLGSQVFGDFEGLTLTQYCQWRIKLIGRICFLQRFIEATNRLKIWLCAFFKGIQLYI